MRHQSKTSTRRGVALIVALLAILVLSVLGTSLLFTTNTEEVVARNYRAEVEALFAAHAGLAVGLKHAFDDYTYDTEGGWGNSILALGTVVPAAWRGPNVQLDTNGTVTGTKNCYYYDLKDWQCSDPPPATPCSPPIDDATWDLLADSPYNLPPSGELQWSDTGPGKAAQYLPSLGSFRLKFQGMPETTSDPVSGYERDRVRIQAVGLSGGAIGGVEGGVMGVKSTRMVLGTYKIKDIGMWNNAFFGTNSDMKITGNCQIRGSIHYLNSTCPTCPPLRSPAVEFYGNSWQHNNYSNIQVEIGRRIPTPPNNDLDAEFRLRTGSVSINGQAWLGVDCGGAQDPCEATPAGIGLVYGKGPNDGAYVGNSDFPATQFTGNKPKQHREDELDEYDAMDFDLAVPKYDTGTYTDSHGHIFNGSYVEFLQGVASGLGVHALTLAPLATTDLSFPQATSATYKLADDVAATGPTGTNTLYTENTSTFPSLTSYDFEVSVPWQAGWGPTPTSSKWRAAPYNITSMDFLYDSTGVSDIVGVFKHLPKKSANPASTCVWETEAGGHGFLYIPYGANVGGDVTMAELWNFIQRNFVRYEPALNDPDPTTGNSYYDIKRFLGIAQTNTNPWLLANLPANPDFDANGAVNGIDGDRFGRLLIWDVIYTDKTDVFLGAKTNQNKDITNIVYMGNGSFAQAGGSTKKVSIAPAMNGPTGWLISTRMFPCVDVLGTMNGGSLYTAGGGETNVMMVGYASTRFDINQKVEYGGAFMSDLLSFANGAQLTVDQVPEVADCLPWFMIGNWRYYKAEQVNWSER